MNRQILPIIIDVEASGFGLGSYPIEIGVALADGAGECLLVAPEPHWQHWDNEAHQLHGLDRELLVLHGRRVDQVALRLNQLLARQTVYSDAWGNDSSWLALLFDAAELLPTFQLDTIRRLLSESQTSQWHVVKQAVINSVDFPRHRASNDAFILQETLRRVKSL